jgi:hypothetical protein
VSALIPPGRKDLVRHLKRLRALGVPLLVSAAPIVHLWGENAAAVRPADVVVPLALTVGGTAATLAVLTLALRDVPRTALSVVVGATMTLTFGYQADAATSLTGAAAEAVRWWILAADTLVSGLILAWAWRTRRPLDRVIDGIALFSAIFIALSLPNVALSFRSDTAGPASSRNGDAAQSRAPDIYYIVLDGYGRGDVLEEIFDFSNEPFLNWLEARGFYVADASLANYTRTHLSLASSLNMRYIDDLPPNLTPAAAAELTRLLGRPAAVAALRGEGYTYVHFNTIWWGTSQAPLADVTYGGELESEFEAVFIQSTLPGRLLPLPTWQENHLRTLSHLRAVPDMTGPTFAFAHVLLPHPPFVFDERGRLLKRDAALGGSWDDQEGYIRQLRFLNSWLQSAIAAILDRSDGHPVIVLQGDHGSSSTAGVKSDPGLHRWERTAIFNAYLVPPEVREELYPSISPVNTFRLLLREMFGLPFPPLPDRAMFSPSDTDPRVDVTEQLRGR